MKSYLIYGLLLGFFPWYPKAMMHACYASEKDNAANYGVEKENGVSYYLEKDKRKKHGVKKIAMHPSSSARDQEVLGWEKFDPNEESPYLTLPKGNRDPATQSIEENKDEIYPDHITLKKIDPGISAESIRDGKAQSLSLKSNPLYTPTWIELMRFGP